MKKGINYPSLKFLSQQVVHAVAAAAVVAVVVDDVVHVVTYVVVDVDAGVVGVD